MPVKTWPIRPNPCDGESFTSWIARLALDSGLPPRTFYVQALGWQDVWTKDFDQFDDKDKLDFLVKKTIKPLQRLKLMMVDPKSLPVRFSGYLESHEFTHFCPDCLAEDKEPYFRKIWRSSQVVACPRHGIFLHARCGACLAPVRLLARTDILDLGHCSTCERPYPEICTRVPAPDDLLAYTVQMTDLFRGGWFPLAGQHVHPQLFLRGLPMLAEIICAREVWSKVYDELRFSHYFAKPEYLCFQHRESFVDRCVFLLVLSWILADWSERFTWATSDLPDRAFAWMAGSPLPFWLACVIQEVFDIPGTDLRSEAEFRELTRLVGAGVIDKPMYCRTFGRRPVFWVNGRSIKSFKSVCEEARRRHAG